MGGQILGELTAAGQLLKQYIYLDGEVLATSKGGFLAWRHEVPLTGARGETGSGGSYTPATEPDSMGIDVGFEDPYNVPEGESHDPDLASLYPGVEFGGRCRVEGIQFDCAWAQRMLSSDVATRCANDDCGARPIIGIDGSGHQIPLGFKVPLSSGWWAGNGEGDDSGDGGFVFNDDVRYGSPLDAFALGIRGKDKKNKGRRRRQRRGTESQIGFALGVGLSGNNDPTTGALGSLNNLSADQCFRLRKLLEREKQYGTRKAAALSQISYPYSGNDKLLSGFNSSTYPNLKLNWLQPNYEFDLDWFATIRGQTTDSRACHAKIHG